MLLDYPPKYIISKHVSGKTENCILEPIEKGVVHSGNTKQIQIQSSKKTIFFFLFTVIKIEILSILLTCPYNIYQIYYFFSKSVDIYIKVRNDK